MSFPIPRTDPYAPPAEYCDDGDRSPRVVDLRYGGSAWLVTSYKDARAILADVSFSSDPSRPGYPVFPLASKRPVPGHFLSMDAPEHGRLRSLIAADFTAHALRPLRPQIAAHARRLIAAMTAGGGPADFVASVAIPLPALVAAELLGVPAQDRPMFQAAARGLQLHDATAAQRAAAAGRMNRYLDQLLAAKRDGEDCDLPGSDLLSRMSRPPASDRLTHAELIGIANLVLVAGLETTAGLLGLTVLALMRNRDQHDLLRSDPQRWSAPAIAESLRYWTVVHHGVARVATRDVTVSGQRIAAGEAVVISLASANRDGAVYGDPASFDLARDAHGHLAFGHGPHRCLGGTLAHLEASVALAELCAALPGLRLADPAAEPPFLDDMLVYGLRTLSIDW